MLYRLHYFFDKKKFDLYRQYEKINTHFGPLPTEPGILSIIRPPIELPKNLCKILGYEVKDEFILAVIRKLEKEKLDEVSTLN